MRSFPALFSLMLILLSAGSAITFHHDASNDPGGALAYQMAKHPTMGSETGDGPEAIGSSITFMKNMGQLADDDILYYTISSGFSLGFLDDGVIIIRGSTEGHPSGPDSTDRYEDRKVLPAPPDPGEAYRIRFQDTTGDDPVGMDKTSWNSNFFYGDDPEMWVTEVPGYTRLVYEDLWNGFDLIHELNDGHYTMELKREPWARNTDLTIQVERYEDDILRSIDDRWTSWDFNALMELVNEDVPTIGEEISSSIIINGDLLTIKDGGETRAVLGDPLIFSTFLGGTGWDESTQIAVDCSGDMYVARYTESTDFPTTNGAYDEEYNGGDWDIFISKLGQGGTSLEYSTFFGGYGGDVGMGLCLDDSNNVYLTGYTDSPNFPTTPGAFDTKVDGIGPDAFTLSIGPMGDTLRLSTLFGGNRTDSGTCIEVGPYGDIYIGGYTQSDNFPTTSGVVSENYNGGTTDSFVVKLKDSGTSLVYSTYLGGTVYDEIWSIAVDTQGRAHVLGETASEDLIVTPGAFDTTYNGGDQDLFISVLNGSGESLDRSTYLGGSGGDYAMKIILDGDGYSYLTGGTNSIDYPSTINSYDRFNNGGMDAIVTKINISGDHLIFSTYIGGDDFDGAYDIDVDDEGYVYLVGTTKSMGFPASDFGYDRTFNGGLTDVFLCKLNVSGKRLLYTTFYGGGDEDFGTGIAYLDKSCVFITGYTSSTNLPTTPGSLSPSFRGGAYDGFISRFNLSMAPSKIEEFTSYYGDKEVSLRWKPPIDKGGSAPIMYRIYRGITPGYMNEVGVVSGTTFLDTGLTNGEKYLHQVAVFNDIGQGPMSDIVTTKPRSLPGEPLNLDLEWGDDKVILRWAPPSDTGGISIIAYNIYRGETSGSLEFIKGVKNVLEYTDTGLRNGVTYYYRISANNSEGEGPMGGESSAIPASVPGNPVKLTSIPGDRRILLGWGAPEDVGGFPILGYNIYRGIWGTNLSLYITLEAVTSYDDVDVENGDSYNYSINCFNEIGEGEMGPSITSTPGSIPDVVLDLQGLPGNNMATLSWSPPADDGGFDLTGYRVYRGRDIENMKLIGDLVQDTSYIDRNIENGKLFHYKVSGVNDLGEGPFSQVIDVIPSSVPNPPRKLESIIGVDYINISWEAPGNDGGSPIMGYNVYRGINSLDWVLLVSLPNVTTYEDNNVTMSLIYRYKVSAVNLVGEGDSSQVSDLSIRVDDIQIVETTKKSDSLLWVLIVMIIAVVVLLIALIGAGIVVINIRGRKGGHYPHFDPEMFKD